MNEFENNPAKKTNDVPHAIQGFVYSFVFFLFIFVLGAAISLIS
ncbi:MAG TPA: YqzM family protein [Pseudogracilibacillus sp.]|nr:YqzM family protein [Pseudogracilibacillus sp.]